MERKIAAYILQVLFVGGIAYGSQSLDLTNKHVWIIMARYILYILIARGLSGTCVEVHIMIKNKSTPDVMQLLQKVHKYHIMMFIAAIGFLIFNEQILIDETLSAILIATAVSKYPEVQSKVKVNYGNGMACSYFEGYLINILPSDGGKFVGFQENMRVYESRQGVVFPVKKLFIIVTKSLYSPPALKDLDRFVRKDGPYLEACSELSKIEKDVAGVKNRIYNNTAYKIYRAGARPVYLSAQAGTPLHTLHSVLRNRELSEELEGINKDEVVSDFVTSLRKIIAKSPECCDKCELIYYDDTNRELSLAELLLDKIRELEPDFERIIATTRR